MLTRLAITLSLGAAVWLAVASGVSLPGGVDAARTIAAADDPVRLAELALDKEFDARIAVREINEALGLGDVELARSFLDLAAEREVAIPPALITKIEFGRTGCRAALEQDGEFRARLHHRQAALATFSGLPVMKPRAKLAVLRGPLGNLFGRLDFGDQRGRDRDLALGGEIEEAAGKLDVAQPERFIDLTYGDPGVELLVERDFRQPHRIVGGRDGARSIDAARQARTAGDGEPHGGAERQRDSEARQQVPIPWRRLI